MKTRSAVSYFGSDSEVAEEIAILLRGCTHVTIPFCGGLSILPHLSARAVVANDLHHHAIVFYRTLSGPYGPQLIDRCRRTLSHPHELRDAVEILKGSRTSDDVSQAWAFWAACWIGRKGKAGTKHIGGMPSIRRTADGGTNSTRVQSAAADLVAWAEHFKRCEWECDDFRNVLAKCSDSSGCGIYCDPPWFGAGRNYLHEFTDKDHVDLACKLDSFTKTRILVRYGDCPEARAIYANWDVLERSSRTQANAETNEVWFVRNHDLRIVE